MLLGAGASHASDLHLPTMRTFFSDPDLPRTVASFLAEYYGTTDPTDYDLEEVLTHLFLSERRAPGWIGFEQSMVMQHLQAGLAYWTLLGYVRARLNPKDAPVCGHHVALFDELQPLDSVISLNYDLVADQALHRHPRLSRGVDELSRGTRVDKLWSLLGYAGKPIDERAQSEFTRRTHDPGYYLKLHGSINWRRCRDPECPGGVRVPEQVDEVEFVPVFQGACEFCGGALESVIIPPVAAKSSNIRGRLQRMWTTALRELAVATKIVVWGVSFAASDADLRWLVRFSVAFRGATRPQLHVINPDAAARRLAQRLFQPSASAHEWADIEEYLKARPPIAGPSVK